MDERQTALARHALGLDNPDANGTTYRNRYFARRGSREHVEWELMCSFGLARCHSNSGEMRHYSLSRPGAIAALKPGETLCSEDFPPHGDS